MVNRIAVVLSVVLAFGALANASELWNNGVTYNGNWSEPNWYDSGTLTYISHPGGTVDTRISGNSTVTVDVSNAQCGPLFVGRGGSGTLAISDGSASLLVSKASTELLSVGYDGNGVVNQSGGLVKVSTADLSSELRISHGAAISGTYNLSGGILDVEKLARGGATWPAVFNATGGTLVVRNKIYKFGLTSAGLGFNQGTALLAPAGLDQVGTIGLGDSGNKTDYKAGAGAVIKIDIASDTSYDVMRSYGKLDLDNASILVNYLGTYTPGPDSFFDVWLELDTAYAGSGNITMLTPGTSYEWKDLNLDGKIDTLRIPEPATLSILALGLGGLIIRRKRS